MQQNVPSAPQSAQDFQGGQKTSVGAEFLTRKLNTPLDKMTRNSAGKRSTTRTKRKRGRYIKATPMQGRVEDLAFDATLRSAAVHQKRRRNEKLEIRDSNDSTQSPPQGHSAISNLPRGRSESPAFHVRRSDYQKKIRVRRASNLILFVVDASWSMAVAERMAATKGAIMSLLTDAYQRRDRVGLIVFQKAPPR